MDRFGKFERLTFEATTEAFVYRRLHVQLCSSFASTIRARKDRTMGDKGGKKNKDKDKKQKSAKHEQKVKGAQDKNRPKG